MSLLEVTVLLAAIVVISAALAPAVLRTLHDARQDAASKELAALYRAINGDDEAGVFGYVGDMGTMPTELTDLVERGVQPLFATLPESGVGYGWNGPYVLGGDSPEDFRLDPWGKPYDVGMTGAGQLRSAGPNGVYDDEDDLVYPASYVNHTGTLVVSIRAHDDGVVTADPEGCSVTLYFANAGSPDSVVDSTRPYSFTGVHRGLHPVEVSCPGIGGDAQASAVAAVRGFGAQQAIELHVVVVSAADDAGDEPMPQDDVADNAPSSEQE